MRQTILLDPADLRSQYAKLKTIGAVAEYFGVSPSTIKKNFKNNHITFKNTNKLKVNDNFFSTDTPHSFYVAGFIAADGNVCKELSIRLSKKDRRHLEKINNILQSQRIIRDYPNEYSGVSVLRISSPQIITDLKKFGVIPNKSLIYQFPKYVIDHPLRHHFMRGYFDGDGSFWIQNQYHHKVCFGLRGTVKFLLAYRDILERECGLPKRKNAVPVYDNCGMLSYGGNKNISKISDFLYKDATLFLERKRNISLNAPKWLEYND